MSTTGLEGPQQPAGGVYVPPKVARLLHQRFRIDAFRVELRDADPAAYRVLLELRLAALAATPGYVPRPAPGAEHAPESITTEVAAARLGVGSRAVRQAIARGRLPAQRHGRTWRIHPDALTTYTASKHRRTR